MSDWDGIDEFVAVATSGSFTAGGRLLNVSTTHMSRAIAALESRLQAQLLHRTTRSLGLTDTGRVFLEHCRRMIDERNEAIALIAEHGTPQGELRITCSTALGERFVAPLVMHYCRNNPGLSVNLELSNRVVDLVSEGFDIAVRTGMLADSRLIGTRIASRTLHTCAAPDYLERRGIPHSIGDLAGHECLTGSGSTWRFNAEGREELFRPVSRWRCNSGAAVCDAAIAGMGICQLPEFYVLPHIATGALVPILETYHPADEPIWAVYPQRRHLSPKIVQLIDLLRTELPDLLRPAGSA